MITSGIQSKAETGRTLLREMFREELWQKIQDMATGGGLSLGEIIQEVEAVNRRLEDLWRRETSRG